MKQRRQIKICAVIAACCFSLQLLACEQPPRLVLPDPQGVDLKVLVEAQNQVKLHVAMAESYLACLNEQSAQVDQKLRNASSEEKTVLLQDKASITASHDKLLVEIDAVVVTVKRLSDDFKAHRSQVE